MLGEVVGRSSRPTLVLAPVREAACPSPTLTCPVAAAVVRVSLAASASGRAARPPCVPRCSVQRLVGKAACHVVDPFALGTGSTCGRVGVASPSPLRTEDPALVSLALVSFATARAPSVEAPSRGCAVGAGAKVRAGTGEARTRPSAVSGVGLV